MYSCVLTAFNNKRISINSHNLYNLFISLGNGLKGAVKRGYAVDNVGDNMSAVAREYDADTARSKDVHEVVRQTNRTERPDSISSVLRRHRIHRLITTATAALQRFEIDSVLLDRRRLRDRTAGEEASGRGGVREHGKTFHAQGRSGAAALPQLQRTDSVLSLIHISEPTRPY